MTIRWVPGVRRPEFTFELAAHILDVELPERVPSIEEILAGGWAASGACRGAPVGVFYPSVAEGDNSAQARQICAGCPVRAECLVWAIQCDEPAGIWAGFDEDDRRHIARRFRPHLIPVIDHGTEAGHAAHHRHGIPPCKACLDAHAIYQQHTRPSRAGGQ